MLEKNCSKCKRTLPTGEFYKNSRKKDLLDNQCKSCFQEKIYEWRKNNPDRHTKNILEGQNKRIKKGLCMHCTQELMPNSKTLCEKHWYIEISRQRLKNGTKEYGEKLRQLMVSQNYTCPYTGERLIPGVNTHLDHIYPKHRFPELVGDIFNVEWVSEKANLAKNGMTKSEFIEFCRLIVEKADLNHP